MKIKKGDNVEVISGKDRGKRGEVLAILPKSGRVIVKGANLVKRHVRSKREGQPGERIEREASLHVSNVMLVCPETSKPTRVGYRIDNGEKVRISKRSGKAIS